MVYQVRRELLGLLRKANIHTNATATAVSTPKVPNILGTPIVKKLSILEQKLTAPPAQQQPVVVKEKPTEASICKDLASAVLAAPKCGEDVNNVYVPLKTVVAAAPVVTKVEEIKQEVMMRMCLSVIVG